MNTTSSLMVRPRANNGLTRAKLVPPLYAGDQLTQPEFHRRYLAMPPRSKAELIEGIVYMPSPMRWEHGSKCFVAGMILGMYTAETPGVSGAENTTVILSDQSEPQPDYLLRLSPEHGGKTVVNERGYLVGPPELIIEISHSTLAIDLHSKKSDYQAAGVREYLVFCIEERELRAFDLAEDKPLKTSADGIYRAQIFLGLWIDVDAVFVGDAPKGLKTLRRGLKSREHAAFVKKLTTKPARRRKR